MRYSAVLFLILVFSLTVFAQPPKNSKNKKVKPAAATSIPDEKEEMEKAVNVLDAAARIAALQKFIEDFPQSEEITRAKELIVSARARLGEDNLTAGDTNKGVEFFKNAVRDAPAPISEKLFTEVVIQFPTNLFFRGQRAAAFEVAQIIEEKAGDNPKQLLGLATFYIGIENATNARRLAQKAIDLAPQLPAAYHTLGIANRLGFRLDEAVAAYTRALELDPELLVSKRSLAEMKRANGKPDEAVALYREILEKNAADANAKTGLILALFESGKQSEAEAEMQKSLEANPNDLPLLVGAAYWYAAHKNGAKAVDLAQKALAIEPRYTWANIALARGFLAQNRPLDAEKILLAARNYGDFPTLDYEIAAARLQSGLYREAAEELRKNFAVKNGLLETYLGNRVGVEAEDFLKLLSLERRAAIFSFEAADTPEMAERLKSLLEFSQELNKENPDETVLSPAADKFIGGDDKMKIHRQLFVAGRLLDKKKNLPKVIELTQASVKGVDTALDVPTPSAAVMADELYETRTLAISRGEVLIMPEVPRRTLSVILRGRIEELSGWSLYQQDKAAEAVVRLKRAVSVLPEDSNWWRSSVWRLGSALEADGKTGEALENYIKSYKSGESNPAKYIIIETLYQKVNGSSEGLEEKIGKRPEGISDTIAKVTETLDPEPEISPSAEPVEEVSPTPQPQVIKPEETQTPDAAESSSVENPAVELTTPTPIPDAEVPAKIENVAAPARDIVSFVVPPSPEPAPTPEIIPDTTPLPEPTSTSEEAVENTPEELATPTPETLPSLSPTPEQEVPPSPTPEVSPAAETADAEETEITDLTEVPSENAIETVSQAEIPAQTIPTVEPPPPVETKPAPTPVPETTPAVNQLAIRTLEARPVRAAAASDPPVKNNETQNVREKPARTEMPSTADSSLKSIFDPIVINVRKKEPPKPKTPESVPQPETDAAPKNPSVKITDSLEPESKQSQSPKRVDPEKTETKNPEAGSRRPRVVIEDKFETGVPTTTKCELVASQENVWLINGGGSLGILVGFAGPGDAEKITAVSSSPADIEISLEPEIGATSGRAFFIIKSVSAKKGAFTVTFNSPCGKKEVQVRVR